MSEPSVTVKGKKYFVGQISVVLKLNTGPLIYLKLSEKLDGTEYNLSNEESFKKEFFQDIGQEEEGNFQWNGITIKFILVGYHSSEARTFELVGLVVKKELTDWFNENNFKSKPQDYFIYQKHKGKDSWIFLNKVLGDKFKQPPQDFIEKTKLLFPDNACIWRYKDSNNFHFLNRAIAFTSRHLPEVQGWGAFDSDKPLRLILFEEQKQDQSIPQLDDTWNPSYPFLPNRYSWNRWLDSSCTLSRDLSIKEGQEMALIKELVTDGDNGENPQKGQNFQGQNPTRLLYVPGTINLGKKNLLCKAITYAFKLPGFGEELPSITMKLDIEYPERQIGDNERVSLRLSGKFQAWEEEKEEETKVKIAPSDDEKWGIIDETDQTVKSGADAVLYNHILSPTYSDKEYSGIYVKHEKDDEMIVDIYPCDIPLVLGSLQKYHQKLEEADIAVSGEKLALSISPHFQKLDDSEAIILEKSQIKLNHGKQIFGQAMNKVDFLSQNVEIGSTQVNVNSGQTKINSLVNVSFPSPKMPKPIIPGTPTGVNNGFNGNEKKERSVGSGLGVPVAAAPTGGGSDDESSSSGATGGVSSGGSSSSGALGSSSSGRVAKPGGKPEKYRAFNSNNDVPTKYRNDPRFNDLATDPDQGNQVKPSTRAEAMAGLEAESQGLVPGPIERGPEGIEFYDAQGRPWDVKTPPSPPSEARWKFNAKKSGKSIKDELRNKATPKGNPPGSYPNKQTGQPDLRRVILDSSYLTEDDHRALWTWLNNELTEEELSRIVEVITEL
ncbi:MAG: hypothetical protein DSM107014_09840 [Gomphosphaeria aponina SAG 52.96 = DSM 107014]|uniref:Uncharacterized protein n=1 Tax=Gomphosphaeria aponina SAG 52.96 = DSM 107014 TaxID=1521640 RepID=A0A941GVF7_9CHRO|nr:hypothetical protein [Gomphosphaeria aponina SAG 52.96 = DSM 107014]